MATKNTTIAQLQHWIKDFVIHYNLCPFAKKPFVQDQIRYVVHKGTDLSALAMLAQREMLLLQETPPTSVETTLIIIPHALDDFNQYLDFLEVVNSLIFALRLEGVLQIASFHPDYQFAGTEKDDVTNNTNRAPFPLIHLLREASIEAALENYDNPEHIPKRNEALMRELGDRLRGSSRHKNSGGGQ